jgi:hypothetical protein
LQAFNKANGGGTHAAQPIPIHSASIAAKVSMSFQAEQNCVLFSYCNRPVQQALDALREQHE